MEREEQTRVWPWTRLDHWRMRSIRAIVSRFQERVLRFCVYERINIRDDGVSMIETNTRVRVFKRYLRVYRGRKRSVAITTTPVCIPLMDVCVCVRVKATHAEDDPAVESRAAVLCGNARRHLGLSILLPTLRPRPLQPPRPFTVVRSPSPLPSSRAILFLFCSSFSLGLLVPALALLFRFCSARLFVLA